METYKLLQNDTVLLSQPELIKHFGRSGAQLLSQLNYWLTKKSVGCTHENTHWIYNTAEEWAEQLQLSARYVRKLFAKFVELGIVRVKKLHKIRSVRTNYYSIDYEELQKVVGTDIIGDTILNSSAEQMTGPLGTNDLMYIHKLTTKDLNNLNKSISRDDLEKKSLKEEKIDPPKPSLISPTNTTCQDMQAIWNSDPDRRRVATLNPKLCSFLVPAFKQFGGCLEKWKRYCESMSARCTKGFKPNLSWALSFHVMKDVLADMENIEKAVDEENKTATVIDEKTVEKSIESLNESPKSKDLRRLIVRKIGAPAYHSWFSHAKIEEDEAGNLRLIAPTSFVEQYWETHFDWVIKGKL